jgi:hypothetical protein
MSGKGINLDACTVFSYGLYKDKWLKAGFEPTLLEPRYQKAIKLVDDHLKADQLPAPEDLIKLYGDGIIEECQLAPEYLMVELKKRFLHHYLATNLDGLDCYIKNGQPIEGLAFLKKMLDNAPLLTEAGLASSITDQIGAVKTRTKKAILGEDGIHTPWPSFNALTRGFLPCESTWFAARAGVGKTWIILILCAYFWLQRFQPGGPKVRILLISPELKKAEIAERVFTFVTQTSYAKVVAGKLDTLGQQNFFEKLDAYQGIPDFYVMDEDDGITPERIEQAIREYEPDIVGIDAAYEIEWTTNAFIKNPYDVGVSLIRKWTRMSWPCTHPPLWSSSLPNQKSISFLLATQSNRAGSKAEEQEKAENKEKKGKGKGKQKQVAADTVIALTDKIFWKADRVFLLEQTTDEAEDHLLQLERVKVRRRGADIQRITLYWNMDTMHFDEVGAIKELEDTIPNF